MVKNKLLYKLNKLKRILKKLGSVLIAYSGGVDSSFLLKVANDTLKDKVIAVTAISQTYPKQEINQAKKMAKDLGIRYLIIKTEELNDLNFKRNPINRCYYCKRQLFYKLKDIAQKLNIACILDGTTCSDTDDFRPGELAKKEFCVFSPLREAGLKKEDIRILSKKFHLSSWNKPSLACLASRIPYGMMITKKALKRIDKAERFIRSLGFKQVRVRDYNQLARIEVEKKEVPKLITNYQLPITDYLKKIGYNYITIDLEGYRSGSMNEAIKKVYYKCRKKSLIF